MQQEVNEDLESSGHTDVRTAAKKALLQILEPLAGFASDLGFSAGELQTMMREAAVKNAAASQLDSSNRINISGIAATTGIPRSEISRILKVATPPIQHVETANDGQHQSTNRILAAWHADPKYTGANGQPADLKMYGRAATFEALAKKYGLGIPTRAVLDELVRSGAIELLPNQRVRAKASMTIDRGMSARAIKAFGDRAFELLSTMLVNMRKPEAPKFIASVADTTVPHSLLPLFKKELSVKGADFLTSLQESVARKPRTRVIRGGDGDSARISVTIYYYESSSIKNETLAGVNRRRNFRRTS